MAESLVPILDGCGLGPSADLRSHINVRDFGGRGDGKTDDTAAFARAAQQAASGQTLWVPAGEYRINPLKSVALRSGTTMRMDSAAVLSAIPVSAERSAVLSLVNAQHVSISGGTIVGERAGHLGTVGEWGMGVDVRGGSDVTLENLTIMDCWGDGIYVGAGPDGDPRRVTISHCQSTNNRRQGLSITGCVDSLVEYCTFSGTHGTAPSAGVDIEPNPGSSVNNVTIRGCLFTDNAGLGLELERSTLVVLEGNRSLRNGSAGISVDGSAYCTLMGNSVEENARDGIAVHGSTHISISSNLIHNNSRSEGLRWNNVELDHSSNANDISGNDFATNATPGPDGPRYDVSIAVDCAANRITQNRLRPRGRTPRGEEVGGVNDNGTDTQMDGNS